jgi:hypothetical protein
VESYFRGRPRFRPAPTLILQCCARIVRSASLRLLVQALRCCLTASFSSLGTIRSPNGSVPRKTMNQSKGIGLRRFRPPTPSKCVVRREFLPFVRRPVGRFLNFSIHRRATVSHGHAAPSSQPHRRQWQARSDSHPTPSKRPPLPRHSWHDCRPRSGPRERD